MAKKKKQALVLEPGVFQDFNINFDGKRPTIRHVPLPETSTSEDRRREKRETEGKRLGKLMRENIRRVKLAIANKSEL
jgi:hypothetical protein